MDDSFGAPLWVVSLVISGIVGAVISIALQRTSDRWWRPLGDYELWIDYTATPLFMEHATDVSYVVDGTPVRRPYRVRLWAWRAGAKDVRADSFSGDFVARLGVPVIPSTVRADEHASGADVHLTVGESASWRIEQGIVRSDFFVRYDFISDGLPNVQTHNPVADLRVSSFYDETENQNLRSTVLASIGAVLLAGGLLWIIIGLILSQTIAPGLVPWVFLTMPAPFVGILFLASSSDAIPRRARLARKLLRARVGGRPLPARQIMLPDNVFVPRDSS
ncbi:hypothetical protein ITJ58_01240 [Curtobacterium flaccumfaciens]|uniref:hypothetical protein n=1 Tax=Curtobacterium flaccumfaciens TaxID=2035 RepID=UPI00188C7045|nr:hypothetical protein [Curtobacterium flaccumfaciens]MBF4592372.1 hypothetical protein [Curtobacterium flaccumfaciens]